MEATQKGKRKIHILTATAPKLAPEAVAGPGEMKQHYIRKILATNFKVFQHA